MEGFGWLEMHDDRCVVRFVHGHEVLRYDVPLDTVFGLDRSDQQAALVRPLEIETDGETTLVEAGKSLGCAAVPVRLKAVGSVADPGWQYSLAGEGKLGTFNTVKFLSEYAPDIATDELAGLNSTLTRPDSPITAWWVADVEGKHRVAFEAESGLSAAIRNELDRLRNERRGRDEAARITARAEYWDRVREEGFVMPYNFVPLAPARVVDAQRGPSTTHACLSRRLESGRIDFTAKAVTPLLLRGYECEQDEHGEDVSVPRTDNGRVVVRGSTLKGALRSVFEPLTGSCLSIFDTQTRPVYRDPATGRSPDWRLAIVSEYGTVNGEPDARPRAVTLCSKYVWVPEADVRAAGLLPETGQRFNLTGGVETTDHGRNIIQKGQWRRSRQGAWVVLVTDTGARQRGHPWYWAMGLIDETATRTVTANAWQDFIVAVAGTDDSRRDRRRRATTPFLAPVDDRNPAQPRAIGKRKLALRRALQIGVPLWVHVKGTEVDRLALSYLWRTHSQAAGPGQRVPPDHLRCSNAQRACPACQVFGLVAGGSDPSTDTGQSARGHIDNLTLASVDSLDIAELPTTRLPALGAPRPGSGQTYLQLRAGLPPAKRSARPLSEWGALADGNPGGQPAPIRGRKLYWKSTPLAEMGVDRERHSVHTAEGQGNDSMLSSAKLVPAGTSFAGSFRFSNLSQAQVGALLAVLKPGLIWGDEARYGWSLGGGKPLGLGTIETETITVTLTAAERYEGLDKAGTTMLSENELADRAKSFAESAPRDLTEASWPALKNLLTIDYIPGDVIDYPPDASVGTPPREPAERYLALKPGFKFWRQTMGHGKYNLVPMPEATDESIAQQFEGDVVTMDE